MRKYEGPCDGSTPDFAKFTKDVDVSVDLVNVGDCRVRIRLLRRGFIRRRKFVEPCDWTDPPLEELGVREIEFSCRRPEREPEDGGCAFAYSWTAKGRYRGRCRGEGDPLSVYGEFKQAMAVVVSVENMGKCDVHIKPFRRVGAGPLLARDVVVAPGDSTTIVRKEVLAVGFACMGDAKDGCAFRYRIDAS